MLITELPVELLEVILGNLEKLADVLNASLVCKHWNSVAWSTRKTLFLRKFPFLISSNQLESLLQSTPFITTLQMPTNTSDSDLQIISSKLLHLKRLHLIQCRNITNSGLKNLSKLKFQEISLYTSWEISSLEFLQKSVDTLQHLNIRGCDLITDESLKNLWCKTKKPFSNLQILDCGDCRVISKEGFSLFKKLFPNVKELDVSGCDITPDDIKEFSKLTKLEQLILWSCPKIDDNALENISKYPSLTKLVVYECDMITELGIHYLSQSKSITFLKFGCNALTIRGVEVLLKIENLKVFRLISNIESNLTSNEIVEMITNSGKNIEFSHAIF